VPSSSSWGGDKGLENYFGDLPKRYPGRVGSYIGYHEENSHWIEAAVISS